MKIKIFGKESCHLCQSAKKKVAFFLAHWNISDKVEVTYYNLDTVEGLAEGAYYNIIKIPTIILENELNETVGRWEEEIPLSEELKESLDRVSR